MVSKRYFGDYSLMVGRFQPLHNGHLEVIRKCAAESENLTIGIGSAQYSHERDNPFTAGERYLMIDEVMKDEGITNYCIVPIEDINRYSLWVAQVESLSPPFSIVYSNNPLTRRLFREAGYELRETPLYNREVYSGTAVRKKMIEGDDWRPLVPRKVAEVIDYMDGVERLREISGGE
ncbi:MAG: nicotinamide-nucleotide adenylyltransferase [Methanomassiliicoccaceae archaeon]|nr:nicotinamide-nucleotide adenylyltransferase [Methanomassiliicoccaceae archaeon]